MLWFLLGMVVGGILGMVVLALMVAAKQADAEIIKRKEDDENGRTNF